MKHTATLLTALVFTIGGLCLAPVGRMAAAAASAPSVEPVTLVEAARPTAAILASPAISPSEKFAVEELRSFIRQMSGAVLPVSEPSQALTGKAPRTWIVVGRATAEARRPDLDLAALGPEGFVIRTLGSDLVIAGGDKRGTLYGVYSFLESLGCRWWTDDASTIPSTKTIRVSATQRRERPRLEYRDLLYQERWVPSLWGVRNKLTSMTGGACEIPAEWGGSGPRFHCNLVHSWRSLIKLDGTLDLDDKTGKAKPEWMALVFDWQGKPVRTASQPCTRNPEVREAILRGALKLLRQHTNDLFVTVGQEDGPDYCHCTQFGCADLVTKEGSASALVLDIANEAADRVAKEFPGKFVMAPAYMWGLKLPKTLRPRDNVIMSVAPIDNDFGHPLATGLHEQNVRCRTAIEEWQTAARRMWIWDYTCNFTHYLMPHPNLDVLAPNVSYYAGHRATGYMAQGSHTCVNAEFSHLRMWVLAKALWNPDVDNQALVAEFCNGYYGPAGRAVLKYIDAIHRPVRQQERLYVSCYNDFTAPWLAPEVLAEAEGYLREAEVAVANDAVLLDRVRLAHIPLQYVLAVRQPSSATWKQIEQKSGKTDRAAFANSLADRLDQFFIKTGKPWGMDETGGRSFPDFVSYLRRWGQKAGATGDVFPPDLPEGSDVRLVHPWQMDQQRLAWSTRPFADPDASDGWAMRAQDEGWTLQYPFVPEDDFIPGRAYTLFIRVRCPQPTAEGDAFACGIHGKDPLATIRKSVPTRDLTPNRYQVVELGTLELKPGHTFWIAPAKNKGGYAVSEVRLDCLWLKPTK